MKIFLTIYGCLLFITTGWAQKRIDVEVNGLANLNGTYIILSKGMIPFVKSVEIIDSVQVINGKFRFSFTSNEVFYYALRIKGSYSFITFLGKPGDRVLLNWETNYPNGNTNNVTVIKSAENKIYYKLINKGKPLISKLNNYMDSASNVEIGDTLKKGFYIKQNIYWGDSLNRLYIRLLKTYPKSYSSLSALSSYYKEFSDEYVRNYIKNLPAYLKNNELVKKIEYNKFELPVKIKNVSGFKDFTFLLPQADTFRYNIYIGKIVLIDFWASWCGPCISNFPKLEAVKKSLDTNHFEIISVSLDDNFENWIEGMKKHQTSFVNVFAPEAWESLAVKFFKIKAIPRYVLLGKDGKVLNDNVKINDLTQELSKALEAK